IILYDSWSPAMISAPAFSYVKNCKNGMSPKETEWWYHDDKASLAVNTNVAASDNLLPCIRIHSRQSHSWTIE
ncbi:hypothetical protein HID58_046490, partial [Brassica napus]